MVDVNVKKWMASYFETGEHNIENILKNEKATTYLLIWPIMEQCVFGGNMGVWDIKSIAPGFAEHYDELGIEFITEHFYDRYQNAGNFKHLYHEQNKFVGEIKNILEKSYSDLSIIEKIELLLFVVYRYRNNIFHGNKGVLAWENYSKEINLCLTLMITFVNCAKQYGIKKKSKEGTEV